MSLGNRFVSHLGAMSQRCRSRVAVARCKWALTVLEIELITIASSTKIHFIQSVLIKAFQKNRGVPYLEKKSMACEYK